MQPRLKSSLLWGAVGTLAFLVLLQGYQLVTGYRYPPVVIVGATVAVALGATVLAYLGDGYFVGETRPREANANAEDDRSESARTNDDRNKSSRNDPADK